jgi:hypothetical protein
VGKSSLCQWRGDRGRDPRELVLVRGFCLVDEPSLQIRTEGDRMLERRRDVPLDSEA